MKNFNSIALGILSVAVAVLFYLQLKTTKTTPVASAPKNTNGKSQIIAYFNLDTLETQYEFAKVVNTDLRDADKKAGEKIVAKQKESSERLRAIQEKYGHINPNDPNLSNADRESIRTASKEAQDIEADFQAYKQELATSTSGTIKNKQADLLAAITNFVKEYNKNNTYAYIFTYNEAMSNVLFYKDSAFDITADIVKGLNEQYKKTKK